LSAQGLGCFGLTAQDRGEVPDQRGVDRRDLDLDAHQPALAAARRWVATASRWAVDIVALIRLNR
jgi:hypothetical protein